MTQVEDKVTTAAESNVGTEMTPTQLSLDQRLLIVWIGLVTANMAVVPFISSWPSAFERSFFEGLALFAAYVAIIPLAKK